MEQILKEFQKVLTQNFFVKPDAVGYTKSFYEDLKLSESEFVAMIAHTENAFHIQIADNEIPKIRRVRDIVKYINQSQMQ
ncbi:acyl carrier protein [Thermoflexibacter ruber]|uniref:Acyl carrier protein n=1 Tax=Thermoflexibacter ruber TaxID=1003 RepID=A0A1I2ETL6_9BACT|nr:acyl carrier protein [Thermoflexibacter ruber]SFE95967.1 acyl carrier protein [Thermoflexibacter ruber]